MKNIIKLMDVITKEEEKEAGKLQEEFYKAKQEESESADDTDIKGTGLTPVEELSCSITDRLAEKTADRFSDMVDGKKMDLIIQIISRLDRADSETAVGMLQSMFLLTGDTDMAKDLDMIGICAVHNETAFDDFICALFDTDEFDWFIVEMCIIEAAERSSSDACLS